jgi:hypothetical protein
VTATVRHLDPDCSEEAFERWVIRRADARGWCGFHVRYSEGAVRGIHTPAHHDHLDGYGWPDWVFIRGKQILFRELKSRRGAVRGPQRRWLDALKIAGCDARVWRPTDEALILDELT